MAKNNLAAKIFAILALFWIFISIVSTWILFIFWNTNENQIEKELTKEQLDDIIKNYNLSSNTWTINSTWATNILDDESNSIINTWSIEVATWNIN